MKQLASNYTFNAAEKTVTLNNLNIPLSQILMVASKGKVLYSFADGVGVANYSQGANSVLTLQNTDGLSNTDKLTIFYDDIVDDSPNYINRYALTLNYQQKLTFENVDYGIGTVLIPENRGRSNFEVITTSPLYAIFGEDGAEIYNRTGTNFSKYCTSFGKYLSANVSYKFAREETTTGKIFLWTDSNPLTYRSEVIASERSSIFNNNNIGTYYNTLQEYSLTANKINVNEGQSVTITLSCKNVVNDSNIPYIITGISNQDLSSGSLSGDFIVNDNIGTISLTFAYDANLDENETLVITSAGKSLSIPINDGPAIASEYSLTIPSFIQLGQKMEGSGGDNFGYATAMNDAGDIFAVTVANIVKIFKFIDGSWVDYGSIEDGSTEGGLNPSAISLNSSGDTIAIGSPLFFLNGNAASGTARVYKRINDEWVQQGESFDGLGFERRGFSVSLNSTGNIVAVSRQIIDMPQYYNGNKTGCVQVYEFINGSWVQIGQDLVGDNDYDFFGYSVSLNSSGNILAVAAPYNSNAGTKFGHVRVYEFINGSWVQQGQDINGKYSTMFGDSIYITKNTVRLNDAGDVLAIGYRNVNPAPTVSVNYSGFYAAVYKFINGSWVQQGSDIFGGSSISLNATGDIFALGFEEAGPVQGIHHTGSVKIYKFVDIDWVQQGSEIIGKNFPDVLSFNDNFGWSVSLNANGNVVGVGSPQTAVFNSEGKNGYAAVYYTTPNDTFNQNDNTTLFVATTGLIDGSEIPYEITGIDSVDIDGAPLTGNFIVDNNSSNLTLKITTNSTKTLTINYGEKTSDFVINPPFYRLVFRSFVNNAPIKVVNYITEGSHIQAHLETKNVPTGTEIPYSFWWISPGEEQLIGNIPINGVFTTNNYGSYTIIPGTQLDSLDINLGDFTTGKDLTIYLDNMPNIRATVFVIPS